MDKELRKLSRIEILELMLSEREDYEELTTNYLNLQSRFDTISDELDAYKRQYARLEKELEQKAKEYAEHIVNTNKPSGREIELEKENNSLNSINKQLLAEKEELVSKYESLKTSCDKNNEASNEIAKEFEELKAELVKENISLNDALVAYEKKLEEVCSFKDELEIEYQNKVIELSKEIDIQKEELQKEALMNKDSVTKDIESLKAEQLKELNTRKEELEIAFKEKEDLLYTELEKEWAIRKDRLSSEKEEMQRQLSLQYEDMLKEAKEAKEKAIEKLKAAEDYYNKKALESDQKIVSIVRAVLNNREKYEAIINKKQ